VGEVKDEVVEWEHLGAEVAGAEVGIFNKVSSIFFFVFCTHSYPYGIIMIVAHAEANNSNKTPLGSRGMMFQKASTREAGAHGLHSVKE
jgi:hypothetical protein